MAITVSDVRLLVPYTAEQISDGQITAYIDYVLNILDNDLGYIFSETVVTETDCYNYETNSKNGTRFIPIGPWSETNLNIKKIHISDKHTASPSDEILVLGEDYVLMYAYKNQKTPVNINNPVIGIELLSNKLYPNSLLRVWGTRGWSSDYPQDVKYMVIQIVSDIIGAINSKTATGGAGFVKSEKDLTSSITYEIPNGSEMRNLVQSLYNNIAYTQILNKYNSYQRNMFTIA